MAMHIVLAFPVCLFPARAAMDFYLRTFYKIEPCMQNSIIQSFGIIFISAFLAVMIPQVQTVFGLLGSTIAVSQTYMFPAAMLLAQPNTRAHENKWSFDHRCGWALVVWSGVTFVLGTASTLIDMLG